MYLSDLQLSGVFASYSLNVEPFIQESSSSEHIVDSASQLISGFVRPTFGQDEEAAQKFFEVDNPMGKPFSLLQIDNGLIQSHDTQKCDCAIADDKHLCFIEFKANASSSNPSVIHKHYKKAIIQLTTTINLFDNYHTHLGNDIQRLRIIEAFICFRQGYPRSTSSQMNYKVAFAANNKGIPLSFTS